MQLCKPIMGRMDKCSPRGIVKLHLVWLCAGALDIHLGVSSIWGLFRLSAPPKSPEEGYHLSEDLAEDAIKWLDTHKALQADKPFYMYWASGAIHGPHHIMKEWADKYKGKFDDGWDNYRERVFKRAKAKGWIPENAQLTPRHETMPSWESIPEDERPFQRRLMEVAAGYAEHVDVLVGRVIDKIDQHIYGDNTLIFYIWGDNGSSSEGQNGTISELLAQNGICCN
jgi:arylsulfatase A-like enzyme